MVSTSRPIALEHLGDPVRRRLVEHLDLEGSAAVEALAQAAGVHANTARAHLAALEEAGVVVRHSLSSGARGRPRLGYRIAPGWRVPAGDFKGIAEALAGALASIGPSARQL